MRRKPGFFGPSSSWLRDRTRAGAHRDASRESEWYDDTADPSESRVVEKLDTTGDLHAGRDFARGFSQGIREIVIVHLVGGFARSRLRVAGCRHPCVMQTSARNDLGGSANLLGEVWPWAHAHRC